MSRELLKRVLHAKNCGYDIPPSLVKDIEAELAKPEPDPVGIFSGKFKLELDNLIIDVKCYGPLPGVGTLLYTHPPAKQKPLSDDEIKQLWEESLLNTNSFTRKFARSIEKAHGITS